MFDTERANRGKEVIQKQAVILSKEHDNLLLSWATGTSKTKAALEILEATYDEETFIPKVYILLKETNHEENWRAEFKKWDKEYWLKDVTFFCYASLHKYLDEKVNLLILDECHALSEMREDYLKTIKCDKIISLSATVNEQVRARIKAYKPGFYEYHIGLQEAIDLGILPEPSIKVVYVDLDDKIQRYLWKSRFSKMLTGAYYYKLLDKRIAIYEKKVKEGHEWAKNKWIMAMGERKKFMAKAKTEAAKRLLQHLDGKRYICFCGSIQQAEELGSYFTVHSKIGPKDRALVLKNFESGLTQKIFAVGMLRESMNLEGIEAAIIVQLDNQVGSAHQMWGRGMRALSPEIYMLILRGTKDEDYLNKVLMNINNKYVEEFVLP